MHALVEVFTALFTYFGFLSVCFFLHHDLLLHLISILTCIKFADRVLRSDDSARLHKEPKQTFSTCKRRHQPHSFRPCELACTTPQHAIKLDISRSRWYFPHEDADGAGKQRLFPVAEDKAGGN